MKLVHFSLVTALVVLTFYLLIVGQQLLLPLVIAIVFWFLINLLGDAFGRLEIAGIKLPTPVCYFLSILTFVIAIWGMIKLITLNIDGVVQVAPAYQNNLEARLDNLLLLMRIEEAPTFEQLVSGINLREIITSLAASLTSIAANGGVILIYMLFLSLEQGNIDRKISALLQDSSKERKVRGVLTQIGNDVRKYIGIKMLTSCLTGVLSYAFLKIVDVDFAAFWALLIFLLNFIPTVGSIIATIFPSLITLVQFESLTPFFIVGGGLTTIQFCIGNVLEPRLMGNSLNLSPMVILLNLTLWGMIWGIPGMFLCVPLLVITMIVCSHIPAARPIAIMLSRDGVIGEINED